MIKYSFLIAFTVVDISAILEPTLCQVQKPYEQPNTQFRELKSFLEDYDVLFDTETIPTDA